MQKILVLCSILVTLLLAGCASKIDTSKSVGNLKKNDPLLELKNISVEARDELRLLSKTTQAINEKKLSEEQRKQRHFKATVVQAGFKQLVTFNFWGEAEEGLEKN